MSSALIILKKIATAIESFNDWVGRVSAWLVGAMVAVTFFVVVAQLFFKKAAFYQPYSRVFDDLILYIFSALFMFGIVYTLKNDNHVRVDIFYRKLSARKKAWINLLGTALFLFPVCAMIFYFSLDWVIDSWKIGESSPQPGGIDFIYGLKTLLVIMPVLVAIQGVAIIIHNVLILLSGDSSEPTHGSQQP